MTQTITTTRQDMINCIQQQKPFFDDGVRIAIDVVYDRANKAMRVLDGDLAPTDSKGRLCWIPVESDPLHTLIRLYRVNTGKDIAFAECSQGTPWLSDGPQGQWKSEMKVVYTITGELYTK